MIRRDPVTGASLSVQVHDLAAAIQATEAYHLAEPWLRAHLKPALRAIKREHPEWKLLDGVWLGDRPDPFGALRGRHKPPDQGP